MLPNAAVSWIVCVPEGDRVKEDISVPARGGYSNCFISATAVK